MYLKAIPPKKEVTTHSTTPTLKPNWEEKSLEYRDPYNYGTGWDCWMVAKKPEHHDFTLGESGISSSSAEIAATSRLEKGGDIRDFIFKADNSLTGNEYHIGIKIFDIIESLAKKKIEACEGNTNELVNSLSENLSTPKDLYVAKEVYTQLAMQGKLPENASLLKEQLQQKEAEAVKDYIKLQENSLSKTPYTLEAGEYRPHLRGSSGGSVRKVVIEKYDNEVKAKVKEALEKEGKQSLLADEKQITL